MRMYMNPLFLCLLFLSFCMGIGVEVCLVFAVAFLHECGHILAAHLTGTAVLRVSFMPWGVCMEAEPFKNERAECLTALAGPLTNLLLLGVQFFWQNELFMLSNLFMFLINLLPVLPLDGGRILKAILTEEVGKEKAIRIMHVTALILTVLLFGIGVVLFYKTGVNFSVLIIAIFLACSEKEPRILSFGSRREIQKITHYAVFAETKANRVLKFNSKAGEVMFDILDGKCAFLGSVTLRQVMEAMANFGYEINFAEILQKQLQNDTFCSTIDTV